MLSVRIDVRYVPEADIRLIAGELREYDADRDTQFILWRMRLRRPAFGY